MEVNKELLTIPARRFKKLTKKRIRISLVKGKSRDKFRDFEAET